MNLNLTKLLYTLTCNIINIFLIKTPQKYTQVRYCVLNKENIDMYPSASKMHFNNFPKNKRAFSNKTIIG